MWTILDSVVNNLNNYRCMSCMMLIVCFILYLPFMVFSRLSVHPSISSYFLFSLQGCCLPYLRCHCLCLWVCVCAVSDSYIKVLQTGQDFSLLHSLVTVCMNGYNMGCQFCVLTAIIIIIHLALRVSQCDILRFCLSATAVIYFIHDHWIAWSLP